jgi:hypothetical protein
MSKAFLARKLSDIEAFLPITKKIAQRSKLDTRDKNKLSLGTLFPNLRDIDISTKDHAEIVPKNVAQDIIKI